MKTNNQAFIDLMETIKSGGSQQIHTDNNGVRKVSIELLQVKKGFHCKLNEILYFCQKIENGEVLEPIEVNQNNLIVDGAKRYFAYKRLNYKFLQVKGSNVFIEEFIGDGFKIKK